MECYTKGKYYSKTLNIKVLLAFYGASCSLCVLKVRQFVYSYCSGQIHCVTASGDRKLIFGKGTKLTVESREY